MDKFASRLLGFVLLVSLFLTACGQGPSTTPVIGSDLRDKVEPLEDLSDKVTPLIGKAQWTGEITFKYTLSDRNPVPFDPGFPMDFTDLENFEEVQLTEVVTLGEMIQHADDGTSLISAEVESIGTAKISSYSAIGDSAACYGYGEAHAEAALSLHENAQLFLKAPDPGEHIYSVKLLIPNERHFKKEYVSEFKFDCGESSEPKEIEEHVYNRSVYFHRSFEIKGDPKVPDRIVGSDRKVEQSTGSNLKIITEVSWNLDVMWK